MLLRLLLGLDFGHPHAFLVTPYRVRLTSPSSCSHQVLRSRQGAQQGPSLDQLTLLTADNGHVHLIKVEYSENTKPAVSLHDKCMQASACCGGSASTSDENFIVKHHPPRYWQDLYTEAMDGRQLEVTSAWYELCLQMIISPLCTFHPTRYTALRACPSMHLGREVRMLLQHQLQPGTELLLNPQGDAPLIGAVACLASQLKPL
eukprot:1138757-Pelagomonas_calceolata.AAC.1